MGFVDRLLGRAPARAPASAARSAKSPPSTQHGANSVQAVRKELVKVTVRDTLVKNGIPADWIRSEPLTTASPGREPGVHVRLVVLHWEPRLMQHVVALQDNFEKRLQAVDPNTAQWLMGVSWQFAPRNASTCPPLPHPGIWTAQPPVAPQVDRDADTRPGGSADVISGPTRIAAQQPAKDARKDLERLMGERDAYFGADTSNPFGKTEPMGFDPTQPMGFDKTEPASFDKTQAIKRS